jgi:hypothetical protein
LITDSALGRTRPLYFLHIPKTGGTSLTDALLRRFEPEQVILHENGNFTLEDLAEMDRPLAGPLFISGHPGPGVLRALQSRCDIITLLRDPRSQAVSHYLHVLADPGNQLYDTAAVQSFSDFLRETEGAVDFQARTIREALATVTGAELKMPSLATILAFLDSAAFVGVTDRPELNSEVLSALMEADGPIELPCLRTASDRGISAATIRALELEYDSLRDDPRVAAEMAIEARVHARAVACLEAFAAGLRAPRGTTGFIAPWRFLDREGPLRGVAPRRPARNGENHIVYGPFERLPRGHFEATFHLDVEGADRGRILVEVATNRGPVLHRRWRQLRAGRLEAGLTLRFFNPDPENLLEYRVRAQDCPTGVLVFRGVTVGPSDALRTWPSRLIAAADRLRQRLNGRA